MGELDKWEGGDYYWLISGKFRKHIHTVYEEEQEFEKELTEEHFAEQWRNSPLANEPNESEILRGIKAKMEQLPFMRSWYDLDRPTIPKVFSIPLEKFYEEGTGGVSYAKLFNNAFMDTYRELFYQTYIFLYIDLGYARCTFEFEGEQYVECVYRKSAYLQLKFFQSRTLEYLINLVGATHDEHTETNTRVNKEDNSS